MKRIIIFCALATVIIACSKDKFKTEPQVEIISLSPDEVFKGDLFTLRAVVRDKEGDIKDSVFVVRKVFTGASVKVDTLRYTLRVFAHPYKSEIELNAVFSYGELRDGYIFQNLENSDKEFSVGLIVRDTAGHKSPYVESDKIVLKKL
ncbi:MAG: hypothetical protein ACXWCZ_10335 [Flavisolibacter sp.]